MKSILIIGMGKFGQHLCNKLLELDNEIMIIDQSEEQIREEIEFPQAYTCVCEADGLIVGFATMQTAAEFAGINELGVLSEYRRRGIGRMIMEDLLRECASRGCDHVSLEVRRSNAPAKNLYRSFGFSEAGVRKDFYRDPQEDALVLVRNIKEETD